jgi:hypothetical protein
MAGGRGMGQERGHGIALHCMGRGCAGHVHGHVMVVRHVMVMGSSEGMASSVVG